MDKYLDGEMIDFSNMMKGKGYREVFLVNSSVSGELLEAMYATVMKAEEQEYDAFPMILHTRLADPQLEGVSVLMLRVDRTDSGLKIRDAEVESLMNNRKHLWRPVAFAGNEQFPSKEKLMSGLLRYNKAKHKRKGI